MINYVIDSTIIPNFVYIFDKLKHSLMKSLVVLILSHLIRSQHID